MSKHLLSDGMHARRDLLRGAAFAAAGGLMIERTADAADPQAGTAKREALRPAGAPAADVGYSPAIVAQGQRLVFISGQGPNDIKADMETQIRQTLDKIGILLKAAGGSFANVVMVRTYWIHLRRDLPIFRKVRREYLVEPYPASTAVGTPELATEGLELEIEAVAVV